MQYNKYKNLSDIFISSAEKNPSGCALYIDDTPISYGEVLDRSSRLATLLKMINSSSCAFLSAHGSESYIALLGILLAGKTCLPLTTKNPSERNKRMLEFADCNVICIDEKCQWKDLDFLHQSERLYKIIFLGTNIDENLYASLPHHFIRFHDLQNIFAIKPTNTKNENAFLLFTSGSTGSPKAIMTTHENCIDYISWMKDYFKPNAHDRFTQLTDLTFDAAIHEIFLCWSAGGTVYVLDDHHLMSIDNFINKHRITFWISVPAIASLLLSWQRITPGSLTTLRSTQFLGEPLSYNLASQWLQLAPNTTIDNLYGPTEATITFTLYRWNKNYYHSSGYVPIGLPINNQKVVILDEQQKPVKLGESGEIYLAGSQLAKGYWNSPQLTQERFCEINSLVSDYQEKRWYRTGDMGQMDKSCGLIFKSRDVDIIKVRGGRVEKIEIEMQIKTFLNCEEVAVLAWPINELGIAMGLVCFTNCVVDKISLERYLRRKLPDYMIPTNVFYLSQLPLNKNNKVDYKALSAIADQQVSSVADEKYLKMA